MNTAIGIVQLWNTIQTDRPINKVDEKSTVTDRQTDRLTYVEEASLECYDNSLSTVNDSRHNDVLSPRDDVGNY